MRTIMSGDDQKEPSIKVPSQVFRWFEKMKNNYEQSVQAVLGQFQSYTEKQQARLDRSQHQHLDDLKRVHQHQLEQNMDTIKDLKNDIHYYQQQINQQQHSIEQLNSRYDAVMRCLLQEKTKEVDIKEVFSMDDFLANDNVNPLNNNLTNQKNESNESLISRQKAVNTTIVPPLLDEDNATNESWYNQGLACRQTGETEQAFVLFSQAANAGHIKAMAAMGRSYFLAEGTEENKILGLAWLIHAASKQHPPAVNRVQYFQENDPRLYEQAKSCAAEIIILEENQ